MRQCKHVYFYFESLCWRWLSSCLLLDWIKQLLVDISVLNLYLGISPLYLNFIVFCHHGLVTNSLKFCGHHKYLVTIHVKSHMSSNSSLNKQTMVITMIWMHLVSCMHGLAIKPITTQQGEEVKSSTCAHLAWLFS